MAQGISFATQDYLALSREPSVRRAVAEALAKYGPHAGSSPILTGHTPLADQLKREISQLTGMAHIILFPTGWGAGYGSITGLIRPQDHVVLDERAHACLNQGAHAATRNVVLADHLHNDSVHEHLARIRAHDTRNAVMVVTEGVYSMDSDTPRLAALQDICHAYDATLLVDVAHDLGALGPGGTGKIGEQGLLGQIDLVMGSFSKCFATNGGFIAARSENVAEYLSGYATSHFFSSALSPLQAAAALQCARIIQSPEGERRRAALEHVATRLRAALTKRGLTVLGDMSAIVPVETHSAAVARVACKLAEARGLILAIIEFPAVPLNSARFRMQLMCDHLPQDMDLTAQILDETVTEARELLTTGAEE
ncbi:aminotransferase class I/II-fold pyridoxal phosphate-dependent enzyme [Streptomyces sp. WZ-12]|uniref:aminotransferase class I/II-fold pyridoxal phosphate-dependent enzyme n=1 Tax=Streptomyces sp. WZ-12 TaxID=3030210 RepID=UPI0023815519|nr:aminotransferase class I/II-fold pyridoxal phosphate-dependent enzyme [Streptomyces sp. WZ-12]